MFQIYPNMNVPKEFSPNSDGEKSEKGIKFGWVI